MQQEPQTHHHHNDHNHDHHHHDNNRLLGRLNARLGIFGHHHPDIELFESVFNNRHTD